MFPSAVTIPPAHHSPSGSRNTGSTNSISTTASTSSSTLTLKTPHFKLDQNHLHPQTVLSSSSLDSQSTIGTSSPSPAIALRQKHQERGQKSPTPSQSTLPDVSRMAAPKRREPSARSPNPGSDSPEARKMNAMPLPAIAQGPLPPTPSPTLDTHSSTRPLQIKHRVRQPPPPPLDIKNQHRLSQDWVQVAAPIPADIVERNSPPVQPLRRLPPPTMVAVKPGPTSPMRPSLERVHTAPTISPTRGTETRNLSARASLDQLRSGTPTPTRQISFSTPPSTVLEASSSSSTGPHPQQCRSGSSNPPILQTRKSEEALRPLPLSKKELKAAQKDQQRSLGVASTIVNTPPMQEERKSSGLSAKKSSGALKALFKRGKGKERETPPMPGKEIPPMPSVERRTTSNENDQRRPSTSDQQRPRPSMGDEGRPRPSFSRPKTPGSPSPSPRQLDDSSPAQGRSSFSAQRSMYPAPPTLNRAASQGHAVLPPSTSSRPPSRNLPPLPPPTPSPTEHVVPSDSPLERLPPSSSLPYLSPPKVTNNLESTSPASLESTSTARQESSLKPSGSLHLLQLPQLDLEFDFAFDSIGASPSTPRKPKVTSASPQRSPTRSLSIGAATTLGRAASGNKREKRRSQSFDGFENPMLLGAELWTPLGAEIGPQGFMSPPLAKLFGTSPSSSAPALSQVDQTEPPAQAVPIASSVHTHAHNHSLSFSSQPSAPSSLDHAQSSSNSSSNNGDTPSPSPPTTPPNESRALNGMTALKGDYDTYAPSSSFVLHGPPDIPLPDCPTTISLAPSAVIDVLPVQPKEEKAQPRERIAKLQSRSKAVVADPSWTARSLAREMERLLMTYRYPTQATSSSERAGIIRNELLSVMVEIEKRGDEAHAALREMCFEWAETLLFELKVEQPANERGACLEGLAAVMESRCLSESALKRVPGHAASFTRLMIKTMNFVMGKLGAKGVFHNTLLFSGRFLAFAFFRIPHVGEQLVTVLQPPRGALMRFTRGPLMGSSVPATAAPRYPRHLLPLCFDNSKAYTARLASLTAEFGTEDEREAFLFQPGNWLRRWQSDDSELFPAFYRAYHRQLALYLSPVVEHYEERNQPIPTSVLLRAPGYAHLATIFAKKCHSYILGSVNAVTTSSSAPSFDATETAGLKGSQKPPVLETANRRLVETLSTFANSKVYLQAGGGVIECDGTLLWSEMIDLWVRSLITKTSLYAPKGVFSLFDLLDGVVDPPLEIATKESILDIPNLIHVIRMILTEGEHALTLVKVIAFVFTHWEVLCARPENRRDLCLELLLNKNLFERLLLFWSQSVRSYVLRLVVFRLGHLHTTKEDGEAYEVEIATVRLLQTRLDGIKKRHDELEPRIVSLVDEEDGDLDVFSAPLDGGGMPRSRSTITMVGAEAAHVGSANKAERLLGLGFGMNEGRNEKAIEGDKITKATSWLKKSFGNKKKKKDSDSPSPSLSAHSSPVVQEPVKYILSPSLPLASPTSSRVTFESGGSSSPTTSEAKETKSVPPTILTSSPQLPQTVTSPNTFAFEFELPTMSPRSDAFDPIPSPIAPVASSPRRTAAVAPLSPRQPPSPHMSRSFSKRSSLLPPSTAAALDQVLAPSPSSQMEVIKEEEGYEKKLHAYAIRMLAELEDAQKEYDEWWSEGGVGKVDGSPPRLTVAWPFHEGEE
ncbi:hypothetical protein P7C73_g4314, partial [Tremellales sp. Uapishka_1]